MKTNCIYSFLFVSRRRHTLDAKLDKAAASNRESPSVVLGAEVHAPTLGRSETKDKEKAADSPAEEQSSVSQEPPQPQYWTPQLDSMWTEASLLLRVPVKSAEDLIYIEAAAEAGLLFMSEMDEVSKSLSILRGTLSRWLLPYDQNTRLDEQSSTPHSVLENMPSVLRGKISERQVHYLVKGANNVRKLVRIKIADDNDLEQARAALKTTMAFLKMLHERSTIFSKTPFEFMSLRPVSSAAHR